jgi:Fe-S oxidoreductase
MALVMIDKLIDKLLGSNVLYYPGCTTKIVLPNLKKLYEELLRNFCKIDFIELGETEVCCGSPALNAGYKQTFKSLAEKNFKVFKEHRIKKIIVNCPACLKTFSQDYPKVLEGWNVKVFHMSQILLETLSKENIKFSDEHNFVTFHDPCYLGRYSKIYDEPRQIIKILGYNLIEMEESRENSLCCGAGGGVFSNYLPLFKDMGKRRMEQAKNTKASILCTACPLCLLSLSLVSNEAHIEMKVVDIAVLVARKIKGMEELARRAEEDVEEFLRSSKLRNQQQ